MPIHIQTKLTVPKLAILDFQKTLTVLRKELSTGIFEAAEHIRGSGIVPRTPVGVSGELRAKFFTKVTSPSQLSAGRLAEALLADGTGYGRYVEEGTSPHWPPDAPIRLWARRVLRDEKATFLVRRKIAREGTEGYFMVREGVAATRPGAVRIMQEALSRAAVELGRPT